jgi:prepilin-type N-terminal cleavage/methylation domain-containing protein
MTDSADQVGTSTPSPAAAWPRQEHAERGIFMLAKLQEKKRDDGFTLVELLVVIAILGILSGIVVFSISGVSNNGQTAACATEKSVLQTAQEAYFAKNNAYAASAAVLKTAGFLASTPSWYKTDTAVLPYEVIKNTAVVPNPCT